MSEATFDLHGIAGVRVTDAGERDVAAVAAQLGPIRGPLAGGVPVVEVRFVDRLETRPLTLLGLGEVGFDDASFVVLRSSHKVPARVAIDLAALEAGGGATFVAERGLPAVPLLIAVLNLVALGAGAVPLHAAAFRHDGRGVLVTGWSKGGKTETLLAFMRRGATYVGDEWVYLTLDGAMHGIPEPIRLWSWHLDQLPEVRARLTAGERARLAGVRGGQAALDAAGRAVRPARRLAGFLAGQRHVDVPPERLFGTGAAPVRSAIDLVCLVGSRASGGIEVRPIDPGLIARRMVHSLAYERRDLVGAYLQHRFAFPRRRSALVESASRIEEERLAALLGGVPAVELEHPYPVEIDALARALEPHLAPAS
jgi:hypothetical protein